jgi:SAM-dependent methyltransferase
MTAPTAPARTLESVVGELVPAGTLTGATLSNPRRRGGDGPSRVTVRPVLIGEELHYSWTAHFATRSTTDNLLPDATERRLVELLRDEYRQGLLHGRDADYQVLVGRTPRVLERPATRASVSFEHDRRKRRVLEEGTPVPFLVELGVMTPEGKVRARHQDKFRQVNRFLELVDDVLPALPVEGRLRVVDFGSGKSYLTFALHHLLHAVRGREVKIVGLDLKEDVVARCSALAEQLGAEGLAFRVGDIASVGDLGRADLVVSLHACDTATDHALAQAVRWNADVILAVPCCQHELHGQVDSAILGPLLRHGLLRERFTSDLTDAVRALLLGVAGYDVQLLEFVELEHTPKNVLVRAVRRPGRETERQAREYRELKEAFGIDPCLERALADELAPVLRG